MAEMTLFYCGSNPLSCQEPAVNSHGR